MKEKTVKREAIVLRRRNDETIPVVIGSYKMQVPVREAAPTLVRNMRINRSIKRKAKEKVARRNNPYGDKLTKAEYANWGMGLRIARRKGVEDAHMLSMNEMISHMVSFGFNSALNW